MFCRIAAGLQQSPLANLLPSPHHANTSLLFAVFAQANTMSNICAGVSIILQN